VFTIRCTRYESVTADVTMEKTQQSKQNA
jgi:hypothetical protein